MGRGTLLLSKLTTRVRARGVREVAGLAAARVRETISSKETLVILCRDTAASGGGSADGELALRALEVADAGAYAHDIGTDSPASFRERLSQSTRCYAVEAAGRLLHASWVTTSCAWTRELRAFLCVGEGEAYVYESFTRADARGRGVYPFALAEICSVLAAGGITDLWVGVEANNEPSLRAVRKAGFAEILTIRYARRLGRLSVELPNGVKRDTPVGGWRKKLRIWLSRDGAM